MEIDSWEPGNIVRLGGEESECISIFVNSRSNEADYWDGNWLECTVKLSAGGFRANFEANFRTDEFDHFYKEIRMLYEKLTGEATFQSVEEQLILELGGDGLGHIHIHGRARDTAGTGNLLDFNLELDQTQLFSTMTQVAELLNRFPVRGNPTA